jgi:hypothetical protein
MVVILLHAAALENTTMHFFEAGHHTIVHNIHSDCIFMEMGVFLLDAAVHTDSPTMTNLQNLLRRRTSEKDLTSFP